MCPCSSFEVYSFANFDNPLSVDITGTYLSVDKIHTNRKMYQKKGNPNIKIRYDVDRWKIVNDVHNPDIILAELAKSNGKKDVCLSDTMHLEWETTTNINTGEVEKITDIKVRHRCKGKMKMSLKINYVLILYGALPFLPNHAC